MYPLTVMLGVKQGKKYVLMPIKVEENQGVYQRQEPVVTYQAVIISNNKIYGRLK